MKQIIFKSTAEQDLKEYNTCKNDEEKDKVFIRILSERDEARIQNAILTEKDAINKARKFAPKTEKGNLVEQLSLFDNNADVFNEAEHNHEIEQSEDDFETITYKRHKKNKKKINVSVVDVVVTYDLEENEKVCPDCHTSLVHAGTKEVRTYNYVPARFEVINNKCQSYKCLHCEKETGSAKFITAKRKTAFPKCVAENNLVSHVITEKYLNAMPLYRQEQFYTQLGFSFSRQNLSNWCIKASNALKQLYDGIYSDLINSDIVHMDETTLNVITSDTSTSYMWGICSSKYQKPAYYYAYKQTREHKNAKDLLNGFKGYVHSDGYQAYKKIDGITNIGCFAHARRKYTEIIKAVGEGNMFYKLAYDGKRYTDRLFSIEEKLIKSNATIETIYKTRQNESKKILDEYKEWLSQNQLKFPSGFAISKAINYSINNMAYLENYLLDGRLEISNNRCERMMKSFVIGRKNFLFSFTENGAEASSILYSIVTTAKENKLKVEEYLTYVFDSLSNNQSPVIKDLLPYSDKLPSKLKVKSN